MRKDHNLIVNCYTKVQQQNSLPYLGYYYSTGYIGNCCGSFNALSWEEFVNSTFGITVFISDEPHDSSVFADQEQCRIILLPDRAGGRFIYVKELFFCPDGHKNRAWQPDVPYEESPEARLYRAYVLDGSSICYEGLGERVAMKLGDEIELPQELLWIREQRNNYLKMAKRHGIAFPDNILSPGYNVFIYTNYQMTNFLGERKHIEETLSKYGKIVYHSPQAVQNTNYPGKEPAMWLVITERL
jgi:hypothetical protein